MEKAGTKRRDIHFKSDKNGIVVCVHSREAREYARYLEASADVASYEAGTVLDPDKYPFINTIGIRKEYLDVRLCDSFYRWKDRNPGTDKQRWTFQTGSHRKTGIFQTVLESHKSCRVEDRCHGEGRVLRCS